MGKRTFIEVNIQGKTFTSLLTIYTNLQPSFLRKSPPGALSHLASVSLFCFFLFHFPFCFLSFFYIPSIEPAFSFLVLYLFLIYDRLSIAFESPGQSMENMSSLIVLWHFRFLIFRSTYNFFSNVNYKGLTGVCSVSAGWENRGLDSREAFRLFVEFRTAAPRYDWHIVFSFQEKIEFTAEINLCLRIHTWYSILCNTLNLFRSIVTYWDILPFKEIFFSPESFQNWSWARLNLYRLCQPQC